MKGVAFRDSFKTDVGEIALNILFKTGKRKSIITNLNIPKNKNQTDVLLSNAIKTYQSKQITGNNTDVILSVSKVLKGLQYLRRSNNDKFFFTILDKMSTSDIRWVDKFNNEVKINSGTNLPSEFYNELSFMLYKKSLSLSIYDNPEEVFTIARYALKLLKVYPITRDGQMDIKRINRCLQLVVKTRSVSYMGLALNLVDNFNAKLSNNLCIALKDITILDFFYQTKQFPKLLVKIDECLVDTPFVESIKLYQSIFKPNLIIILRGMILEGYCDEAVKLLNNLLIDGTFMFTPHDINSLLPLVERVDDPKIKTILKRLQGIQISESDNFQLGGLKGPIMDYISLNIDKIKLPEEIYDTKYYDSIMTALRFRNLKMTEVKVILKESTSAFKDDELKRLFVIDTMLFYVSKFESLDSYISVVRYIISDLHAKKELLESTRLTKSSFPGLYSIFNYITQSNLDILTFTTIAKRFNDLKDSGILIRLEYYISLLNKIHDSSQPQLLKTKMRSFLVYQMFEENLNLFIKEGQFKLPDDIVAVLDKVIPLEELNEFIFDIKRILNNKSSITTDTYTQLDVLLKERFGNFSLEDIENEVKTLQTENALPESYNFSTDKQTAENINILFDNLTINS